MSDWFKFGTVEDEIGVGERGPPGIGFKVTVHGDFDIEGKRLVRVREPEEDSDVATKGFVVSRCDSMVRSVMEPVNTCLKLNDNNEYDALSRSIANTAPPSKDGHVVNKKYADQIRKELTKKIGSSKTECDNEIKNLKDRSLYNREGTGYYTAGNKRIVSLAQPIEPDSAATKKYVDNNRFDLNCRNQKLINLKDPENPQDAASKTYCDQNRFNYDCQNNRVINGQDPIEPNDLVTKAYCDFNRFSNNARNARIINVATPKELFDAANKNYIDQLYNDVSRRSISALDLANINKNSLSILENGFMKLQTNSISNDYLDENFLGVNKEGNYDALRRRITNVAEPIHGGDAASRNFVVTFLEKKISDEVLVLHDYIEISVSKMDTIKELPNFIETTGERMRALSDQIHQINAILTKHNIL